MKNNDGLISEWGGTMRCITSDGRNVNMAEELNRIESESKSCSPCKPLSFHADDGYETYVIDDSTIGVKPKWISVKERLPKKYARVLVTDGKDVCIHYKQSGCNFSDELGHDLYCGGKYDDCHINEGQVTHWMPLPKAPKE